MILRRQWQSLLEVTLCSGVPTQLALMGALGLAGFRAQTADGGLSLAYVAILSMADTVLLGGLVVWLLRRRSERARAVFLGSRRTLPELLSGVVLAPLLLLSVGGLLAVLRLVAPGLRTVPENPLEALAHSPEGLLILLVVTIVAGGVREEVQRGFLLHRFQTDLGGGAVGLVITSAAFGIGHLLQGWDAVLVTAVLGAFWGLLYLRRGSIVAAVVSHALFNAIQLAAAYLQK